MQKFYKNVKVIGAVLLFGIMYLIMSKIDHPVTFFAFLIFIITYLSFNLYSKFRYRNREVNYILFPTKNDQYSKLSSIILGIIIFIFSVVIIIWNQDLKYYEIIGVLTSLLIFLNGICDLPKGKILILDNRLKLFDLNGIFKNIDLNHIKSIDIYDEKILITEVNDISHSLNNLDIDIPSSKRIENYIIKNTPHCNLLIMNHLS